MALLVLFLSLLTLATSFSNTVQLLQLSVDPEQPSAPLAGSRYGGTTLYIRALGLDPVQQYNQVFIGPYRCTIIDMDPSGQFVSCATSAATDPEQLTDLEIRVYSRNMRPGTCKLADCTFSYDSSLTVSWLVPRTAAPQAKINVLASHSSTQLQLNQIAIKMGKVWCKYSPASSLQAATGSFTYLNCQLLKGLKSGDMEFSYRTPSGLAGYGPRTKNNPLVGSESTSAFRVVPKITSMSASNGSTGGSIISLTLAGGTRNLSAYVCSAAGQTCFIKSYTDPILEIELSVLSADNLNQGRIVSDASDPLYIASGGVDYFKYHCSSTDLTEAISAIRSNNASCNIIASDIRAEIYSEPSDSSQFIDLHRGYFLAEMDGNYTFTINSDDSSVMYISAVANSSDRSSLSQVVSLSGYNSDPVNPYLLGKPSQVATILLTKGYHYFEVFHQNTGGKNHLSVSVETPKISPDVLVTGPEVQFLTYGPSEVVPEIVNISIDATAGSFQLYYFSNGSESAVSTSSIPFNATVEQFKDHLSSLPCFWSKYKPSTVTLTKNGSIRTWSVQYDVYRAKSCQIRLQINSSKLSDDSQASYTMVQQHSSPLKGTFKLSYGTIAVLCKGNPDIPYNIAAQDLQVCLRKSFGKEGIEVTLKNGTYDDGPGFTILFLDSRGPIAPATVNATGLTGGKPLTTATGAVTFVHRGTYQQFFWVIPYHLLYRLSNKPSLNLAVGGLLALCDDCTYTYQSAETPAINSFTLVANTLTISMDATKPIGVNTSNYMVSLGGQPCTIQNGNSTQFTCTIANSTLLPAGVLYPRVLVSGVGYAILGQTATPLSVPLIITSITPAAGSPAGGLLATIEGSGLPTIQDISSSTVYFCDGIGQIGSSAAGEISVKVPASTNCDNNPLFYVSFGGLNASFLFSYSPTAPTLTALSINSSSPAQNVTLCVTGAGFGSNASAIHLHLVSSNNMMELQVINSSDTDVCGYVAGGATGTYKVQVLIDEVGYSQPVLPDSNLYYLGIYITDVSPAFGSIGGGVTITITGSNFQDIEVFVGGVSCQLSSLNTTTILGITPPSEGEKTVDIVVRQRKTEVSVCMGVCTFSYTTASTSFLDPLNDTIYNIGDIIILTGLNLQQSVVTVGGLLCDPLHNTDTEIQVAMPSLPYGSYEVRVFSNGGYASPTLIIQNSWQISNISTTIGSKQGNLVKFYGTGLPNNTADSKLSISLSCNSAVIDLELISLTSAETVVRIPSGVVEHCYIYYTYGTHTWKSPYSKSTTYTPNTTIYPTSFNATGVLSLTVTSNDNSSVYNITRLELQQIDQYGSSFDIRYVGVPTDKPDGRSQNFNVSLPAGKYLARALVEGFGFGIVQNVTVLFSGLAMTSSTASYNGGTLLTISGGGFDQAFSTTGKVTVCGIPSQIQSTSNQGITITLPAMPITRDPRISKHLVGTWFCDGNGNTTLKHTFDSSLHTSYKSSSPVCFVGLDFGEGNFGIPSSIRYVMSPYQSTLSLFWGGVFEGSNDTSVWETLSTIGNQVFLGENIVRLNSSIKAYRYLRFRHNGTTSKCHLADLQFIGQLITNETSGRDCPVVVSSAAESITLQNVVSYRQSQSVEVTSMTPLFGSIAGGTLLVVNGANFGSNVQVTIDGMVCVIVSANSTQVSCTTAAKLTPSASHFQLTSDREVALLPAEVFLYADRWSTASDWYWPSQSRPRDHDDLLIPAGTVLLFDADSPLLGNVVVDGTLIFLDDTDLVFQCNSLTVSNSGTVMAGTKLQPRAHLLQIQLNNGGRIQCNGCTLILNGVDEQPTWGQLSTTALPGAISITLDQPVAWSIGDEIAICSTTVGNHNHEIRTIVAISISNQTLQLNQSLAQQHISLTEPHGSSTVGFKASVALLKRSIVVRGNPTSVYNSQGVAIEMHKELSKTPDVFINNVQFEYCGQLPTSSPCISVQVMDSMLDSRITNSVVKSSFTRGVVLRGTSDLLVAGNVVLATYGSALALELGSETRNTLFNNLIASVFNATFLQLSDMNASGVRASNPYNNISSNSISLSESHGLVYSLKKVNHGAIAIAGICPSGLAILASSNNTIHSCQNNGLHICQLIATASPCTSTDAYATDNISPNRISDSVIWGNLGTGLLCSKTGGVVFTNMSIAQNLRAGIDICDSNASAFGVSLNSCSLFGGFSNQAYTSEFGYNSSLSVGIIRPSTDGLTLNSVSFSNFGTNMTVLSYHDTPCSTGWYPSTITLQTSQLHFSSIIGTYNSWQGNDYLVHDVDGTLSPAALNTPASGGWLMVYSPLLLTNPSCGNTSLQWGASSYCTSSVRTVRINSPVPSSLKNLTLSVMAHNEAHTAVNKSRKQNGWIMNLPVNKQYTLFWQDHDFSELKVEAPSGWLPTDTILLHFNYTAKIDGLYIARYESLTLPENVSATSSLSASTCRHGDYFHDTTAKEIILCIKGSTLPTPNLSFVTIKITRCTSNCTTPTYKLWSAASSWQSNQVPQAGTNVTIKSNNTILLDVDTPPLLYLLIEGTLIVDPNNSRLLQSSYIQIQEGGTLQVGQQDQPYSNSATIKLIKPTTLLNFSQYTVDDGYGIICNNANLKLYGQVGNTTRVRLGQIAKKGTRVLSVSNTEWKVGDQVVVSASYSGEEEDEQATITQTTNSTITIDSNLVYEHYGAPAATVNNSYGVIDARATVAKLTRSIKIIGDGTNSSFRLVLSNQTSGVLNGVQLSNCGSASMPCITVQSNAKQLTIGNSSIHGCTSQCVNILNSTQVEISQSTIYKSSGRLLYVEDGGNITIKNNLFGGARQPINSNQIFETCCLYVNRSEAINSTNFVLVRDNLCQGSQGEGYVLPHLPCLNFSIDRWFDNNTAGSCLVGVLLTDPIEPAHCIAGGYFSAYACSVGLMVNPESEHSKIHYCQLMITDCSRGVTLRSSYDSDSNSAMLTNSYISGYSRPSCSSCYSDSTITGCKNGLAVRMFAVTVNKQNRLTNTVSDVLSYDAIQSQQALNSKAFVENVTFENYMYQNQLMPYCSGMSVFRRHSMAADLTGSHYLKNTSCLNCEPNALARFDPPSNAWKGDCGFQQCTGSNNYFIQDDDGTFLGFVGQLLANNSWIGSNLSTCTLNAKTNGYVCSGSNMAVLEYRSLALDNQSRQISPVEMVWNDRNFSTLTSSWRKLSSWGNTLKNVHPAMFVTVVELNHRFLVKYQGYPPTNSQYRLQKRQDLDGKAGNFVQLQLQFPSPQCVDVFASTASQSEALIEQQQTNTFELSKSSTSCGLNTLDFYNGVVSFIVTGADKCSVRVAVNSYLLVTIILDIDLSNFSANNGISNIVGVLADSLSLPSNRIQVRNVKSGSTIVALTISTLSTSTNHQLDLKFISDHLRDLMAQGRIQFLAPVISYNTTINIIGEMPIAISPSDIKIAVYVLIAVAVGVGLIILLGLYVNRWLRVKAAKVHPDVEESSSQQVAKSVEALGEKSSQLYIGDDLNFNND